MTRSRQKGFARTAGTAACRARSGGLSVSDTMGGHGVIRPTKLFVNMFATFSRLGVSMSVKTEHSVIVAETSRDMMRTVFPTRRSFQAAVPAHCPVSGAHFHHIDRRRRRTMTTHMRNFLMAGGMLLAVAAAPNAASA